MSYRPVLGTTLVVLLAACATSTRQEYREEKPGATTEQTEPVPSPSGDFGKASPSTPPDAAEVHEVYGHSAWTLYKLEPKTKAVTVVGLFQGCEPIIDIALDENSTLYAVSSDVLYTVDKTTATCTKLREGRFPNSLSFVPKGTVDPNEEALVGYDKDSYVRIDTKTGARTVIGKLDGGNGVESSGDIVSVKGGKTFLTVRGGACIKSDCLYEVDPTTGRKLHDWGSIEHNNVFGLSFWGGKVYGFDEGGELFEVTFGSNKIVTTTIPIPQDPGNLSFWGAGSSTSAPLTVDPQ